MPYCIKCGRKLEENTKFCTKCGTSIKSPNENKNNEKITLEKQIENAAERFGKRSEQIGKRVEERFNHNGINFNLWYDNTFKLAGPLLSAFIMLIILRIIIYIIQFSNNHIFIFTALSEGLYSYLLLIFASTLLSGYNTYFNRKYKHSYILIYPFVSAIGFIIGIWILAQILEIINQIDGIQLFESIANFINDYLIAIFILAIIIAYVVQFTSDRFRTIEK